MSEYEFNVGIIGWGSSAQIFHIPYITMTPGLKLVGGVTSKPDRIKAPLKHYAKAADLIADPAIDLVVIATPPNTHFELVTKALEGGKNVLCEKPFVPTSQEAEKLAGLAKQKGQLLCVYQNRRWDSDFLTVKKLIAEGTLGRIYEFETHYDRYRPVPSASTWKNDLSWDQGGGPLFDLGTHLIDQAVHLFGKPDEVFGRFTCQRGDGTGEADSVIAVLNYGKGLDVFVRIGVMSVEKRQLRFWIRGSKGSFRKNGLDPQEDQLKAATDERKESAWQKEDFGVESREQWGMIALAAEQGIEEKLIETVKPETYRGLYAGLGRALRTRDAEDVPAKPEEAAVVLRVLEGLRTSAANGKRVAL